MGAFGGSPQKAQSLRLDVQIETRQKHWFPHVNHQLITVSRENVGTLLNPYKNLPSMNTNIEITASQ
jgi:hypothetical protein